MIENIANRGHIPYNFSGNLPSLMVMSCAFGNQSDTGGAYSRVPFLNTFGLIFSPSIAANKWRTA